MDEEKLSDLFQNEGSEISNLSKSLNMKSVAQLIKLINNCKNNIFITGCGTSAMAAKKAVHTLRVISKPAFYLNPSEFEREENENCIYYRK